MFVLLDDYFPKDLFTPMETFSIRNMLNEELLQRYPDGFYMKANHRNDFFGIIENDINFLEKFRIIGYALQIKVCLKKGEESAFVSSNLFSGYSSCGEKLYFIVGFVDCLESRTCECLMGTGNYSSKFLNLLEDEIFPNIKSESASASAPSLEELQSDNQMRLVIPSMKLEVIEEVDGEGDYDNLPMPKFGDLKSPSNVGDWLKIHDFGIATTAAMEMETHLPRKSSIKSSRQSETISTSFSPKVTRFAEEEDEDEDVSVKKKLLDTRKSFRNKSIRTGSDRASVFSYGGRSFRGSITRGFIPQNVPKKTVVEGEQEVSFLYPFFF